MLQPFPVPGPTDEEAERDVAWLKEVIQGVRRIRSELNLPPARMLDVLFQDGNAADRDRQQRFADAIGQLARVHSIQWLETDAASDQCAVALVGELKILLPLKGLVDVEEELARLNKQLEREMQDLGKSEGKLGNRRFVDNAPQEVVEQERQRLAAHRSNVENLKAQLRRLEAMRD
jgi:valyl-tRNA synthetase